MRFYSTNREAPPVSFREAVLRGLATDGGLYMPEEIPALPQSFLKIAPSLSFQEICFEVSQVLFKNELAKATLQDIVSRAFTFDAPLVKLNSDTFVLELFHGPTLAFKDFAARFMAELMSFYIERENKELTILVATSGDTGSAVAHGFYNIAGIKVVILYPAGRVSEIQEKQLTTLGKNITTLEVQGSFDDCQKLVKQVFADQEIGRQFSLASANSINIARLFPQTFYYFYAWSRLQDKNLPVVFSVPSGNFGNLTAGLIAKKMGLPVEKFVAATNINNAVPKYLKIGKFESKPSRQTISNAMDVGDPSNFARMLELYNHDVEKMRQDIFGASFTDDETCSAIREIYEKYNYILDPHGAVGYLGLQAYLKQVGNNVCGIFLETAHPAKFAEIVRPIINTKVPTPARLEQCLHKNKQAVLMPNSFAALKEFLLSAT